MGWVRTDGHWVKGRQVMRCYKHAIDSGITAVDYFWEQVNKDTSSGCWLWQGPTHFGYGLARFQGKSWRAHRLAYHLCWGFVPEGKHLDHLCCNRACVYPWHLEPVTSQENNRRKVLRRQALKTRSAIVPPSGLRNSSIQQRRQVWYNTWLQGFKGCTGLKGMVDGNRHALGTGG